jgi:predicted TIM-barrel fold metal-dependent hydrolase
MKFILCHLGNPWITDASEVLYKNKNVYADISGFFLGNESNISKEYSKMMNKKIMECFYYCGSVDKIMFGTDYPLASHEFYIKFVNKLELSKKDLNKIFFENALKIFNIKL